MLAVLPVTMEGLRPHVPVKINGVEVKMLVDSGAFYSMLGKTAAARVGVKPGLQGLSVPVMGVNGQTVMQGGEAKTFEVAGVSFGRAQFLIAPTDLEPGEAGLFGQERLSIADVEYDLANGVIRLLKPEGCANAGLAYWATDGRWDSAPLHPTETFHRQAIVTVHIDGKSIDAVLDTGSTVSVLSRSTAARLGLKPGASGATYSGTSPALGGKAFDIWSAAFDTFAIGGEQVQRTRLRLAQADLANSDMLLGMDFFLSHRILVSNSQHKVYFSYNGGPVFRLDAPPPKTAAPVQSDVAPTDAAAFSRRGSASAARGDFEAAIADFTRAAELEPKVAQHFYDRARAHMRAKHAALARADLEQALKLDPNHAKALLSRGMLRLRNQDEVGARADFETALRVAPQDADIDLPAASALAEAGGGRRAITLLDGWIAAHRNDVRMFEALDARCWARATLGEELDLALADCNSALKLARDAPPILDSRGLVHLRMGQYDAAIADYDKALGRKPDIAWSLYGRGLAKLKKGLQADGEADLKAATAIEPDLPLIAARRGLAPPPAAVNTAAIARPG